MPATFPHTGGEQLCPGRAEHIPWITLNLGSVSALAASVLWAGVFPCPGHSALLPGEEPLINPTITALLSRPNREGS